VARTAAALTVEEAVKMALENNSQIVQANASLLDARSGLYSSYTGLMPRVTADYTRSGSLDSKSRGTRVFGGVPFNIPSQDQEVYSTTPTLSGSWSVLNLTALSDWSSARSGLKAAQLSRKAARQAVALDARGKYYEVVKAIHLARVSSEALRLSRDDERRVRALFTVGSVSRGDLLKAQVRTAQSELDSLARHNGISASRITLATALGVEEMKLGDVDTVLTAETRAYDEAQILAEAERARPDIMAARSQWNAAKASLRAANFGRLPYLWVSGSTDLNPKSTSKTTVAGSNPVSGRFEEDAAYRGQIGVTWNLANGLTNEAAIASSRARVLRAQDAYELLHRNLASEVRQTLLTYREVVEGYNVAQRALDSATENMKLTQQKYNVGSATILELIDAQVQLQTAQSNVVSALAGMRVGEATVEKVRGSGD
jgi:outer membrane protein TolC